MVQQLVVGALTVVGTRARRRLATVVAGEEPHHFAFAGDLLWASDNTTGSVVRISRTRRRVLGRTAVGPAPHHPAVAGRSVLVAVNGSGRVAVLDRRGRLIRSIGVGRGPHGLAAVKAGGG